MIYFCSQKNRRARVLGDPQLTGIDYVEVLGPLGCGTQLAITMLKNATALTLTPANISITGGTPVKAVAVLPGTADAPLVVTVDLDGSGDFSPYTLALVAGPGSASPPDGFDPQLSSVSFSFKAGCPTPADCLPSVCCPPTPQSEPDINYLAKDYDGFRQVMLDRLAVITPAWTETHAADLGVALVETLAYAADHLSYQQDAVSTEAYLGTARSRISLRRHARLVDYEIGEGCNARVWVTLATTADVTLPSGSLFYVRVPGLALAAVAKDATAQMLATSTQPIFESLQDTTLYAALNQVCFYTWDDTNCCLALGSTEATLTGSFPMLAAGSVLLFAEVLGPNTGQPEDADVTHRWAVRLTSAMTSVDPRTGQAITAITWSAADALPFSLCISSTTDAEHGSAPVANVSVILGNVVAADHGVWTTGEPLGEVPPAPPAPNFNSSCACGTSAPVAEPIPRYRPELTNAPLTFSEPYDASAPASAFLSENPAAAVPAISLQSDDGTTWTVPAPSRDLLSSSPLDDTFVPEIESDGSVFLRFGDGVHGAAPQKGQSFWATYRVGNGTIGNIGRDSIGHVVLPQFSLSSAAVVSAVSGIGNPLAAAGGVDPEDMEHIRQYAPFAYETQLRCVTEADYGAMAAQTPGVSEARGTLRWTGSWYTAFVSIDPVTTLTPQLVDATTAGLNLLRMMGTDLAVEGAIIVGLRIEFAICVDGAHFQGDVYDALMAVFITGNQCSGQSGLLNPSNFVFGETVYASPLIAAAQAVDGVLSATLAAFARMDDSSVDGVAQGYLTMGRLEIPCCDNDPDNLDHGVLVLHMAGGK